MAAAFAPQHGAGADDWPFFRGGASATGVSQTPLPARPDLLWSFTAEGSGFEATAVIAKGIIYVGDYDGVFHAIQLSDGKPLWSKRFKQTGFLSAAAVAGERVYVGDEMGIVRCLDATGGKVLWHYEATGEVYGGVNLHRGAVLATTESGQLVSLDASSGEFRWEFRIDSPLRCWPTVIGESVLLAGCDEGLHAIDVSTGKETARIDIQGPTGATPVLIGEKALFGTYAGVFYSMNTSPFEPVWMFTDPPKLREIVASAACDQRVVVFGSRGRTVHCLDATNGELKWKKPTRGTVESSPILSGDNVFYATTRGRLISAQTEGGDETWSFEAGGAFKASPACADGRLVIGSTDGTLYCFGKKAE